MRRARLTMILSSSDSSSIPRIAMMSCSSLLRCRICLTRTARVVVVLADVLRVEDPRRRGQRVDGRVDAERRRSRGDSSVVASRWANVVAGAGSV